MESERDEDVIAERERIAREGGQGQQEGEQEGGEPGERGEAAPGSTTPAPGEGRFGDETQQVMAQQPGTEPEDVDPDDEG